MAESSIPIVDFQTYSLGVDESKVSKEDLYSLGVDICNAFKDIGFVYLKNHGISQRQIDDVSSKLTQFVALPDETKSKFSRRDNGHGWTAVAREGLNRERPHDLKECYNFVPQHEQSVPRTDDVVDGFSGAMNNMFNTCNSLAQRVLHIMAVGLHLSEPYYFCKKHNPNTVKNMTALRTLYYPGLNKINTVEPNQLRCGEHSDWGSITLLFQDDVGGLEVMSRKGVFVPATPVSGTVLVNIGDLMQRWTDDLLVSTVHRVLVPTEQQNPYVPRQSMAFFATPDNECQVQCLDGCNKYPPIKTSDYMNMKMNAATLY